MPEEDTLAPVLTTQVFNAHPPLEEFGMMNGAIRPVFLNRAPVIATMIPTTKHLMEHTTTSTDSAHTKLLAAMISR